MTTVGRKILIYTALFGNYDELLEPLELDEGCEYICITDNENLKSEKWKIQYCDTKNNPIELNRMYKILPHRFFKGYDYTLYIDSNIQLKDSPVTIINNYMSKSAIAFPRHFMRNCIYDEADFCFLHNKITKEERSSIIDDLLTVNNYPRKNGLAENNILIRDLNNKDLQLAMEEWWDLFNNYASRDQLSLLYILWKKGITYSFMKESSRNDNDYFSYTLHQHNKSGSYLKNKVLLMSAMRDKCVINKVVAKILDRL